MDKINLTISGFKCFKNASFELNNITVMTGANSAGKSSLIQSLLLMKLATEKTTVRLDDPGLALNFGKIDDVINESVEDTVEFRIGEARYSFQGADIHDEGEINFNVVPHENPFTNGFSYLSADRIGPRYVIPITAEREDCGCKGEQTANVISNNAFTKIPENRQFRADGNFQIQLDAWLGTIFPGVSVKIKLSGDTHCQLTLRTAGNQSASVATNVGFGISYALPIVVNCLLARCGSWVVIENPEAHLHAKAQSNMGYFLGMMAASGLRLVIETHSEHVVNGIRRAAVSKDTSLSHDDVNIYYMRPEVNGGILKIDIDQRGNLSDFPVDFFDQARQDLLEIIKSVR